MTGKHVIRKLQQKFAIAICSHFVIIEVVCCLYMQHNEVCGNLIIFQQLEPICQPINNTFCMEFTQLH